MGEIKLRLDLYTVENGIIKSRERAKELIKSGNVTVNGSAVDKPSYNISEADTVEVLCEQLKYVGRGGLKLEKALEMFNIELGGKICADIGASTGGFTDCMLQNNAEKVYAIDVGHDQLDESLAQNSRVINLEKTNIKNLPSDYFAEQIDFITADVSFISLKQIIPKISEFLSGIGEAVLLIKPQFEAGKTDVGKNGIVKNSKVHIRVISEIIQFLSENRLYAWGLDYSPICGGNGNIEYLLYLKKQKANVAFDLTAVVENAFFSLKKKG